MAKLKKTKKKPAKTALQSALDNARRLSDRRRVELVDQQTIGEAIARAVEAAEIRNPGPGLGPQKRSEVIREITGSLPLKGPCAPFLKALARMVVGVLVEIAVAAFQRKWKRA